MQHSIIKKELVRLGEPGESAAPRPVGARPARRRKSVQLLRSAGRVLAVELTCSCGEVSVIEFDYPEDTPSKAAS